MKVYRRSRLLWVAAFCMGLIFVSSLSAGQRWVALEDSRPGDAPELSVLTSDEARTVIEVKLPGFWVEDCEVADQVFQKLSIPENTTTMDIGMPALPVIRTLVAIPGHARVKVSCQAGETVVLEGYRVYPFQEPERDIPGGTTAFSLDEAAYKSTKPYPGIIAQVGDPAIWRHLRVVLLEITPISYVAGRLEINPNPVIELSYLSGGEMNLLDRQVETVSEHWSRTYQRNVINYSHLNMKIGDPDDPGPVYLVVTHPDFASTVQPLADWHHKEGMETEVLSITTTDPNLIKDEITARYEQGDLEYVLLVGDVDYIPLSYWTGYAGDYWYSCITGEPDLYADVAVGRLSVTTSSQADNQIDKILTYEKDPPLDDWLNNVVLVAHGQDAPQKYVGCKENIRNDIIPQPPWAVDTYYGHRPSGTNANVAAAINQGRNIVNYRGHGSDTAWSGWTYYRESWTTSDVDLLANAERTPIVFNIACSNHAMRTDCLGKAWLNKYPGGAVASLGASEASYTDPNHDYDKELFREFCQRGEYRIGWMSNTAAAYIIDNHGSPGRINARIYLWLGDPATEVWTDIPGNLNVSHPSTLPTGPSSFTVHVEDAGGTGLPEAAVCLWKGEEVYMTGRTDPSGDVTFTPSPSTTGTMYVTVSKHDYLPHEGSAEVTEGGPLVSIELHPDQTPVVAPQGGSFGYTAAITNNSEETQTIDTWAMAIGPHGDVYGPFKEYHDLVLAPHQTRSGHFYQHVPNLAPLEFYNYIAYCGDCLSMVVDSSYFQVEVVAGPAAGSDSWILTGSFLEEGLEDLPSDFALSGNYPNPFNASTQISYELPTDTHVKLEIYNLFGQKVATVVDGQQEAGYRWVTWENSEAASGVYFYKLTAGDFTEVKRMTLLR